MGALSSLTPNPTKGGHIMARDEAYYEAEKKIEEAQQSIIYHLFLNNLSLTKIPDSLNSFYICTNYILRTTNYWCFQVG